LVNWGFVDIKCDELDKLMALLLTHGEHETALQEDDLWLRSAGTDRGLSEPINDDRISRLTSD
jgi:hypothetical protein